MAKKKSDNLKTTNPVFSCRLNPQQQAIIFSYDKMAMALGKRPSFAKALEQILIELELNSRGYGNEQPRPRKKNKT